MVDDSENRAPPETQDAPASESNDYSMHVETFIFGLVVGALIGFAFAATVLR